MPPLPTRETAVRHPRMSALASHCLSQRPGRDIAAAEASSATPTMNSTTLRLPSPTISPTGCPPDDFVVAATVAVGRAAAVAVGCGAGACVIVIACEATNAGWIVGVALS